MSPCPLNQAIQREFPLYLDLTVATLSYSFTQRYQSHSSSPETIARSTASLQLKVD